MAHTLEQFAAACHRILKAEPNPEGRQKVCALLQDVLKDEDFVTTHLGDDVPERRILYVIVLGCTPLRWSAERSSPYVGQEQQEIKALATEEIQGYLSGNGMGLAKAAALNHYPGPRHVLDLADQLQLSVEQRRHTQSLFEDMRTEAVRLGQQLIARERHLETLFAAGTITEAQVEALVADIATIHGQLRTVHLRTHLAQRHLLTSEQLRRYDALRGYETSSPHPALLHRGH
jgi:Spy/CpxP family protein refolding chaperone